MRRLYLLRHADAPMAYDMSDKDRPLSDIGINQSKNVGGHLNNIDTVLCSNSKRTKMTCDAVIETGSKIGKIEYLEELYNAPAGVLLNALQNAQSETVLIIAHNPGIHALANMLCEESDDPSREKLRLFYNPATLTILECPIEDWKDIQPNQNKLVNLIIPD